MARATSPASGSVMARTLQRNLGGVEQDVDETGTRSRDAVQYGDNGGQIVRYAIQQRRMGHHLDEHLRLEGRKSPQ